MKKHRLGYPEARWWTDLIDHPIFEFLCGIALGALVVVVLIAAILAP